MKFGLFDEQGLPVAFYATDIHGAAIPVDAVEISEDQWLEFISNQGRRRWTGSAVEAYEPPPPPPEPIRVYKAPMFRTMTDAEYEAYLQIRAAFPPRMQAIFDAAEYLSSDDEFWPDLVAAAEQAYGVERAAEILVPTA